MKTISRIVFMALLVCLYSVSVNAKYCVKLPSCEELGYVFPYKEGRRQIRCPFDTDKVLYLDYCQAYGIQGKPDEKAGEYQECIEEKADGTKINTGYYRYTRCNVGYRYESGHCVNSRIKYNIGDIYYHNGTAIGVVYFDDGETTKIVALKDINASGTEAEGTEADSTVCWTTNSSSDLYDIPNLTDHIDESSAIADMDGKANTSTILSYASANGKTVQAATATSKYSPSVCASGTFCGQGKWYLPALGELVTIYNNLSKIQSSISSAGGTQISLRDYWSSTEYNANHAWPQRFSTGSRYASFKYGSGYVRPVLSF